MVSSWLLKRGMVKARITRKKNFCRNLGCFGSLSKRSLGYLSILEKSVRHYLASLSDELGESTTEYTLELVVHEVMELGGGAEREGPSS